MRTCPWRGGRNLQVNRGVPCAVPWETSVAINTTTIKKPLILHRTTATDGESVQWRNDMEVACDADLVNSALAAIGLVHYNSWLDYVHYNSSSTSSPNHNCSGEQLHVQVCLCFYSSQSVSCGMHMFAHNLAPEGAFHPVFHLKGTSWSGGVNTVSELITGSPSWYWLGGS